MFPVRAEAEQAIGINAVLRSFCAYTTQATRHLNLNSGLFYLQANERTVSLMSRIAARLAREKAWDQSVFNEEIFFLSHDDYVSPNISVRVMNIYKFLNSKVRHFSPGWNPLLSGVGSYRRRAPIAWLS